MAEQVPAMIVANVAHDHLAGIYTFFVIIAVIGVLLLLYMKGISMCNSTTNTRDQQ